MEIKRIIVDEIPNGYKNKKSVVEIELYLNYVDGSTTITEYYHGFIDDPLQVEEECVWSGNYGGEDENGDAIFITKKTSCSDVHIQTVNIPDYKFCPNCGKRIRYAESEER